MSFYERLQEIEKLRSMEVSGKELPITGISTSDYHKGLAEFGSQLEDDIFEIEENLHLMKNDIEYLKATI